MKKIILLLIVVIAGAFVGTYVAGEIHTANIQEEIAKELIRFHVRANSDSEEDQALKLKVKNAIVLFLEKELENATTLDEARNILYDDMGAITEIALDVIEEEGYEYNVDVYFEEDYFPLKVYGDMAFPPGVYEAFRVDIGGAEGKNWWCVLYPPLCFVDSAYSVVPDDTKQKFEDVLSDEAYGAIMSEECDNTYEFRFKFLTFLNKE